MNRKEYRIKRIPKKSGGFRVIEEPVAWLKDEQRKILKTLYTIPPAKQAHGFVRRRSPVTNAREHCKNCTIIRLDLRNFFHSVTSAQIINALLDFKPQDEAERIARLCTVDGRLPQGAPTSPALANIVAAQMDARLAGFAHSLGAVYTRYADDIVFSFPTKRSKKFCRRVIAYIEKIVKDCGFRLNKSKSRVRRGPGQQRKITGVIITDRQELSVPRTYRRRLRARIHQLDPSDQREIASIRGAIAWIRSVNAKQAAVFDQLLQEKLLQT